MIGKKGLLMTQTEPARLRGEGGITEPALEIDRLSTIITSEPGIAEQSLRVTLESLPLVQVVGRAAGCLSALEMVRDRQVDLVVIDANLPLEEVQKFLRLLEQEGRETRSLVLAETTSQVYRALAVGADAALRRDASIQQLGAVVAELRRVHPGKTQRSKDEVPSGG